MQVLWSDRWMLELGRFRSRPLDHQGGRGRKAFPDGASTRTGALANEIVNL